VELTFSPEVQLDEDRAVQAHRWLIFRPSASRWPSMTGRRHLPAQAGVVMNVQLVVPKRPPAPVIDIGEIKRALEIATDPVEIKDINAKADAFEQYMHDCGLYSVEDMRPINELRMIARWKLGRALAQVERATHPGKGKVASGGLTSLLVRLALDRQTSMEAQRIGCMPDDEMAQAFDQANTPAKLAQVIRDGPATRRCGVLLKEIEPAKPGPKLQGGTSPQLGRTQAARDAGLSDDQRKTALRVANVPEAVFEKAVESDNPPESRTATSSLMHIASAPSFNAKSRPCGLRHAAMTMPPFDLASR
jgi:hypothetical protein